MRLITGFLLGVTLTANVSYAMTYRFSTDSFVRMFERHEGVVPGQMRTMPECGCTVLYRGTEVNGNHYKVLIDKLD